jgi:uncharacterized membrane protein (DUF2068 family)
MQILKPDTVDGEETEEGKTLRAKTEAETRGASHGGTHAGGLLAVGLFKLTKAIFFTALGAAALHLIHRDVAEMLRQIVDKWGLDADPHLVAILMNKARLIDAHKLKEAGTLSFLYAAVCVVEGTGLVLRKRWAEFFTVSLTAMGLPWEGYELVHKFSPYKVGLLVVNLVVLGYLLWVLKQKKNTGDI